MIKHSGVLIIDGDRDVRGSDLEGVEVFNIYSVDGITVYVGYAYQRDIHIILGSDAKPVSPLVEKILQLDERFKVSVNYSEEWDPETDYRMPLYC